MNEDEKSNVEEIVYEVKCPNCDEMMEEISNSTIIGLYCWHCGYMEQRERIKK